MSYADESFGHDMFAADASRDARATFIRKTYAHVAGSIAVFIALSYLYIQLDLATPALAMLSQTPWSWLIVLGAFMGVSWLAQSWANSNVSPQVQYMGLGLYVFVESLIFIPLLGFAAMVDQNLIWQAGFMTLMIFGGLTAFVMFTGADFSFLRSLLMIGGLVALGLIVLSALGFFSLGIIFISAMIVLMCGFILYDTSNVLHHYRTDQHVAAALALFASIATLFWYVLQLYLATDD